MIECARSVVRLTAPESWKSATVVAAQFAMGLIEMIASFPDVTTCRNWPTVDDVPVQAVAFSDAVKSNLAPLCIT